MHFGYFGIISVYNSKDLLAKMFRPSEMARYCLEEARSSLVEYAPIDSEKESIDTIRLFSQILNSSARKMFGIASDINITTFS